MTSRATDTCRCWGSSWVPENKGCHCRVLRSTVSFTTDLELILYVLVSHQTPCTCIACFSTPHWILYAVSILEEKSKIKDNKQWETRGFWRNTHAWRKNKEKKKIGVEISGFEPEASRMQSERSTTELYPHVGSNMRIMQFIEYRETSSSVLFSRVTKCKPYTCACAR